MHRATGLLLQDDRSSSKRAGRQNIVEPQRNHIATAKLAVQGNVEERQVPESPCDL
jgi:hypothetical protein